MSRETAFEGVVVSGSNDHAAVVVQPTLQIVEVYFQKMGWLDPFELDAGNWKFRSFPASLAARSWLNSPRRGACGKPQPQLPGDRNGLLGFRLAQD